MNFWQWADHHEILFVLGGMGTVFLVGMTLDGITNVVSAWRKK